MIAEYGRLRPQSEDSLSAQRSLGTRLRPIVTQNARLVAVGCAIGLVTACAARSALTKILYGVGAPDPPEGWRTCLGLHSVTICERQSTTKLSSCSASGALGGFRSATDSVYTGEP
jgi:hypothetical protein